MVQEVVGLSLERIRSNRKDRVGQFSIFVAIVQLPDAHVSCRMNLGVVGRPIVDPDIFYLHALEVDFPGRPGIFIASAGASVIESRDKQPVLALLLNHTSCHFGHEADRVVPRGWVHPE